MKRNIFMISIVIIPVVMYSTFNILFSFELPTRKWNVKMEKSFSISICFFFYEIDSKINMFISNCINWLLLPHLMDSIHCFYIECSSFLLLFFLSFASSSSLFSALLATPSFERKRSWRKRSNTWEYQMLNSNSLQCH